MAAEYTIEAKKFDDAEKRYIVDAVGLEDTEFYSVYLKGDEDLKGSEDRYLRDFSQEHSAREFVAWLEGNQEKLAALHADQPVEVLGNTYVFQHADTTGRKTYGVQTPEGVSGEPGVNALQIQEYLTTGHLTRDLFSQAMGNPRGLEKLSVAERQSLFSFARETGEEIGMPFDADGEVSAGFQAFLSDPEKFLGLRSKEDLSIGEMRLPRNDLPVIREDALPAPLEASDVPGTEIDFPAEPEFHDAEIVEEAEDPDEDQDTDFEILSTHAVSSQGLYRHLRQAALLLHQDAKDPVQGSGGSGFPSIRMPFRAKVAESRADHLAQAAKYLQRFDAMVESGSLPGQSFEEHGKDLKETARQFLDHLHHGTDAAALRELSRRKADPEFLHEMQERLEKWRMDNESFLKNSGLRDRVENIGQQIAEFLKSVAQRVMGAAPG
ncbi:hypothetical protein AB4090_04775 [Acidithiobacillus sp. IBUN Pt1247-S3]|uniref:hypothetical protein n=1 Tax=Acidithiobacillus sp. IBUN Pt1247-S3 TaxID=3166642 RepID=UPI0034E4949D